MKESEWHGCYEEGLQDVIVPDAFSHPAKASWALAKRMVQHGADEGWLTPGARVLDPMAGVGVFGLALAYGGYLTLCGELEPVFTALLAQNVEKHRERLERLNKPIPWLFRHDACRMPVGSAACIVSSPPFSILGNQPSYQQSDIYKAGKPKIASPEFAYGPHPAQIGALRSGDVQAVISSPPYESSASNCAENHGNEGKPTWKSGGIAKREPRMALGYGEHTSQLGNTSHDTYWESMRLVYRECYRVLPTGGHMMLVLKGFIRKGAYVDLPMQTAQLLDDCGFEVVHWHDAMLVDRESQLGLFGGESRRERKSFFRRLAEKKGAPAINAEVVLCAQKKTD